MDLKTLMMFKDNDLALKLFIASQLEKKLYKPFDLEKFSDKECVALFRFTKEEIKKLRRLFLIPSRILVINGATCFGTEALCILLRRMAYPNRLIDLKLIFNRCQSNLSLICNYTITHILNNFENLITDLDHPWLSAGLIQKYADAITAKGSPLKNCFGFIDGTVRPMCRPTKFQRECYNGHKRVHALKYQSVVIPNGLIANMFGPIEGRRHDAYLLSQSKLLPKLEAINQDKIEPFYLYGDPAYPLRPELQAPFKGSRITTEQALFNKRMSMSRVSVEWMFGKMLSLWAFVDFKKNQKLYLQPIAKYYKVATLLTNVHTCMNGSQVTNFFEVSPPSVEEYLVKRNE